MAYATVDDIQKGFHILDSDERELAEALLDEAAVIIDTINDKAEEKLKKLVSCRMVRRSIGTGDATTYPIGATQGSISAGGYAQSWTLSGGGSGELYASAKEKGWLRKGMPSIGSYSPLQEMADD